MKKNSYYERIFKKFIIALTILCLMQGAVFGTKALADSKTSSFALVLESSRAKLNPGDTFDVIVNIRNIENAGKGLIVMSGKFEYDKKLLEIVDITGESKWNFDANSFNEKNLKFITDSGKYVLDNEVAFRVSMKVKDGIKVDKPVETEFKVVSAQASNADYTIPAQDSSVKLHIEKKAEENPDDPFAISSEKYAIKDNIIKYVLPETTVTQFNSNITVNRTTHVMDASGNEQTGDNIVKTGMKLTVDNENIEYTIVVLGDVNRDGKLDIFDLARIKLHLIDKEVLTDINLIAADAKKDEVVDVNDLALIKLFLLGLRGLEN